MSSKSLTVVQFASAAKDGASNQLATNLRIVLDWARFRVRWAMNSGLLRVWVACLWFAVCLAPRLLKAEELTSRLVLHEVRQSDTDLEIGGDLSGLHPGSTRYVTYSDLLKLPQVEYTVSDDSNFAGTTRIGGVALTELTRDLGTAIAANFIVAVCNDGYRTNYPADYLAAHRPLLVLRINGKTLPDWPKSGSGRSRCSRTRMRRRFHLGWSGSSFVASRRSLERSCRAVMPAQANK